MTVLISGMVESDEIDWVNSRLRKAKLTDVSRDFSDGTVLMELIVLLLPHNKIAVKAALEKFNPTPKSMAHSLSNIETVLTCLTADETHIDVEPLDIFRGEPELVQRVLETLHKKYDQNDPETSSTSEDVIPGDSTSTERDNIKIDTSSQQEDAAAPFMLENQGIIIKIKDGDPLCVDKERLIKNSRVFRQFIDELHFYELEMDDFEPDTVGLFLALLEDRQVDNIEEGQFRELHKMSVVFEVEWLREECRNWLSSRINKENMEYNEKLFVFEECLYVLRKWNQRDMMDILFAKIASTDNSDFITKYFQDLGSLDPVQMELMLKLGENKDEMFLKTVLQNLIGKADLGKNVKYLLQRINLVDCSEANNELFTTVFNTISNLPDISVADLKFSLRLSTEIMISMQKKIDIEKLSNSKNNHDECSNTGEEELDNYLVDQYDEEYLGLNDDRDLFHYVELCDEDLYEEFEDNYEDDYDPNEFNEYDPFETFR